MIITLKTHEGNEVVQVRSMSDGLNYQIFVRPDGVMKNGKLYNKAGKEIKSDWVFAGTYAQSIEWALYHAVERYLLESPEEETLTVSLDFLKDLRKVVDKHIKKIVTEVEK